LDPIEPVGYQRLESTSTGKSDPACVLKVSRLIVVMGNVVMGNALDDLG
jgi:hypothetical protein